MWVRVLEHRRLPQHPATLQLRDDDLVGVLDELATDERHVRRKLTPQIHRLKESETVARARRVVIRAECRRHVNNAASLSGRDKVFANDYLVLSFLVVDPVERTPVAFSDELASLEAAHRL